MRITDTYSMYDFYEFVQGMSILLACIFVSTCIFSIGFFIIEKTKLALSLLISNIVLIIVCLFFIVYMDYLQVR